MIVRLRRIVITEMEIYETVEKAFAIATEKLLIFLRIGLTAESPLEIVEKILEIAAKTGVLAEKIIRILGEIAKTTKGIFRTTEDTEVITEEVSGVIVVTDAITEKISGAIQDTEVTIEEILRATKDTEVTIKEISERIVKLKGITNDIIPHAQITGSDILPNVTVINIQVDHPEEEAGVKLTDVRFSQV